jgi:hypothetical protein
MGSSGAEPSDVAEPLIVHSHVMPWGFVVALPLALAFAYVGAWGLDLGLAPEAIVAERAPLWIFSLPLLAFSLFLFLIGVGELATYLRPSVAIVVDANGVTTHGMLGARRMAWADVVDSRIDGDQLTLRGLVKPSKGTRELRLNFNRLEIEPARLIQRIAAHRPDLVPTPFRPASVFDKPVHSA